MADQKVNIKVTAQGAKKAQNELKGVEGAIGKMGKAVGIATGAYFGARGLISGLSTVVQLSAEQELAEKKLSTALGRTSQSLLAQASALQKVTTFGDEAIISQQAFLASLNFSEERIKEIIPLALDLSSATGMALDSAVRNVSKTFSGLQGELGELIPQLKDLTQEELKAGGALEVISELMGGSAQENTETLAGKLEQTKNAVSDAGESLGELLAPTVIHTANAVAFLSDKLVDGAKFIGQLIGGEETAIDTTNEFAGAQKKLAEETERANVAIKDQLTEEELRNQFSEKTVAGYQSEIAQLQELKMVLQGKSQLDIEMRKAGSGSGVSDAIKEEIDTVIALRKEVDLLQKAEDDSDFKKAQIALEKEKAKIKDENLQKELSNTIISGQNAKQVSMNIVKAEMMEQVAGLLSSILKTVPYPFNLIAGAGVGGMVSGLMDKAMGQLNSVKFAETGFEGVVTKPTMFITGENNKPEQVSVTPLGGESSAGININIQGNMIGNEEFVRDILIPEMSNARNQNLA
tara:strand:- start:6290 stop:7852 length:1563 start_codon:yes stop_codon:yes gene_type:complete